MEVIVEGSRSSSQNWLRAQTMPPEELPLLSPEQKELAGRQGISEETFARSAKARELSLPELVSKSETVGRLIETLVREKFSSVCVKEIVLITFHGIFEVGLEIDGAPVYLKVNEDLVDSLLQSGSEESEKRIRRVVDLHMPPKPS